MKEKDKLKSMRDSYAHPDYKKLFWTFKKYLVFEMFPLIMNKNKAHFWHFFQRSMKMKFSIKLCAHCGFRKTDSRC